jgi:hypothetical protein
MDPKMTKDIQAALNQVYRDNHSAATKKGLAARRRRLAKPAKQKDAA